MIPQIYGGNVEQVEFVSQPSRTYKYTETLISGFTDQLDALRQSVFHIVHVERYAYSIYGPDYGIELLRYIGKSFEFLEATIEGTLNDAILHDDRFIRVSVTGVTRQSLDSALVAFNVYTNVGIIETELSINV